MMRTCSIDDCGGKHQGRGWCKKHYERWRRTGSTTLVTDYERFVASLDMTGGDDACHPWMRARDTYGYGTFCANGKTYIANRWLIGHLRGEPLTRDEHVLHHCDNPPCCNRHHLYIGSHADNMKDAIVRGSHPSLLMLAKKNCPQGHPYDNENTYRKPDGRRACRTCRREADRAA